MNTYSFYQSHYWEKTKKISLNIKSGTVNMNFCLCVGFFCATPVKAANSKFRAI